MFDWARDQHGFVAGAASLDSATIASAVPRANQHGELETIYEDEGFPPVHRIYFATSDRLHGPRNATDQDGNPRPDPYAFEGGYRYEILITPLSPSETGVGGFLILTPFWELTHDVIAWLATRKLRRLKFLRLQPQAVVEAVRLGQEGLGEMEVNEILFEVGGAGTPGVQLVGLKGEQLPDSTPYRLMRQAKGVRVVTQHCRLTQRFPGFGPKIAVRADRWGNYRHTVWQNRANVSRIAAMLRSVVECSEDLTVWDSRSPRKIFGSTP